MRKANQGGSFEHEVDFVIEQIQKQKTISFREMEKKRKSYFDVKSRIMIFENSRKLLSCHCAQGKSM